MNQEKIKKLKAAATDCHGWSWPDRNKVDGTHQFGKRDENGNFNEVGTIDASNYTGDYADDIKVLKFIRAAQPTIILELIALAEHSLSAQDEVLTKDRIREIFLANGFTIKEGCDDLKPYVYAAADALLSAAAPSPAVAVEPPYSNCAAPPLPLEMDTAEKISLSTVDCPELLEKLGAYAATPNLDTAWAVLQCADRRLHHIIGRRFEIARGEPIAHLRFRAAQQWSGIGGHDIEHAEWFETCHAHEVGDDKQPAFPVYAATPSPSLAVRDGVDWKARAEAAESRLAEIQRGVEELLQYIADHDWGGIPEPVPQIDALRALLQPQGQADTSGLPG